LSHSHVPETSASQTPDLTTGERDATHLRSAVRGRPRGCTQVLPRHARLSELWTWNDVDCGYDVGPTLIVEMTDGQHPEEVGRFAGLSLEVKDIAAAHERLLAAGVEFTHPPTKQPWGGTLAHFKDPSGNVLTLVSE